MSLRPFTRVVAEAFTVLFPRPRCSSKVADGTSTTTPSRALPRTATRRMTVPRNLKSLSHLMENQATRSHLILHPRVLRRQPHHPRPRPTRAAVVVRSPSATMFPSATRVRHNDTRIGPPTCVRVRRMRNFNLAFQLHELKSQPASVPLLEHHFTPVLPG